MKIQSNHNLLESILQKPLVCGSIMDPQEHHSIQMARTLQSSAITDKVLLQHKRWTDHTRWSYLLWTMHHRFCQFRTWQEAKAASITPWRWILSTMSMQNDLLAQYECRSEGPNRILWNLSLVWNQQPEEVSDATYSKVLSHVTCTLECSAEKKVLSSCDFCYSRPALYSLKQSVLWMDPQSTP